MCVIFAIGNRRCAVSRRHGPAVRSHGRTAWGSILLRLVNVDIIRKCLEIAPSSYFLDFSRCASPNEVYACAVCSESTKGTLRFRDDGECQIAFAVCGRCSAFSDSILSCPAQNTTVPQNSESKTEVNTVRQRGNSAGSVMLRHALRIWHNSQRSVISQNEKKWLPECSERRLRGTEFSLSQVTVATQLVTPPSVVLLARMALPSVQCGERAAVSRLR